MTLLAAALVSTLLAYCLGRLHGMRAAGRKRRKAREIDAQTVVALHALAERRSRKSRTRISHGGARLEAGADVRPTPPSAA